MASISIDSFSRTIQLSDGSFVNIIIYDTPGAERNKAIIKSYYHRADAILLVYDISYYTSFKEIKEYYCDIIKNICKKDIPVLLLGNKTEKEIEREVESEEGIELAHSNNYKFMEASCLKNENVFEAFETLIELCTYEYQIKNYFKSNSISLNKYKNY